LSGARCAPLNQKSSLKSATPIRVPKIRNACLMVV
jgi:hypothetical protein